MTKREQFEKETGQKWNAYYGHGAEEYVFWLESRPSDAIEFGEWLLENTKMGSIVEGIDWWLGNDVPFSAITTKEAYELFKEKEKKLIKGVKV